MKIYTVARSWSQSVQRYPGTGALPESMLTKWHRARRGDKGAAWCSRWIVLNVEDEAEHDARDVGPLCKRCFRGGAA